MRQVRYFGTLVDPREFKRGFGVLGLLVCLLDVLRYWLERRIVLLILRIELRRARYAKSDAAHVMQQAKRTAAFSPMDYHPVMRGQRPARFRELLNKHTTDEALPRTPEGSDGAAPVSFLTGAIRNNIAHDEAKKKREYRYQRARSARIIQEEGDD